MKPRHAVPVLFATTVCLWSALAGPAAAKTEVSIRGRNVTITVPIDAVGIDRSTAREWKRSAEAMWNDAFNSDDNPFKGCINLKLELDIDIRGWSDAARPPHDLRQSRSDPESAGGSDRIQWQSVSDLSRRQLRRSIRRWIALKSYCARDRPPAGPSRRIQGRQHITAQNRAAGWSQRHLDGGWRAH